MFKSKWKFTCRKKKKPDGATAYLGSVQQDSTFVNTAITINWCCTVLFPPESNACRIFTLWRTTPHTNPLVFFQGRRLIPEWHKAEENKGCQESWGQTSTHSFHPGYHDNGISTLLPPVLYIQIHLFTQTHTYSLGVLLMCVHVHTHTCPGITTHVWLIDTMPSPYPDLHHETTNPKPSF